MKSVAIAKHANDDPYFFERKAYTPRRTKKVIGGGFNQRKSSYHRFIGAIANTIEAINALLDDVSLREIR